MREAREEIPFDICERTFRFAVHIVQFCASLEKVPGVPWQLARQLLGAGTSIGANIEESQAAQSRADFISKVSIARKEARETRYWLRLLTSAGIRSDAEVASLASEAEQLNKILTAIIKNTQTKSRVS